MNTQPNDTTENDVDCSPSEDQANRQADEEQVENLDTIDLTDGGDLSAKLAETEKKLLLAHADLENFRKRSRRENEERVRYASLNLMGELLDAVDNLQRAVDAANSEAAEGGLLEGVSMVANQITTILQNHGCQKIDALGQPFDPNLHQAVQMQPSAEYAANMVMQELRSGYRLHDRVIRPTQVFVSTGPAES